MIKIFLEQYDIRDWELMNFRGLLLYERIEKAIDTKKIFPNCDKFKAFLFMV